LIPDLGSYLRDGSPDPIVQNKIDEHVNYRIFFIGYTRELPKEKNEFHQIEESDIPEKMKKQPHYMKELTFI